MLASCPSVFSSMAASSCSSAIVLASHLASALSTLDICGVLAQDPRFSWHGPHGPRRWPLLGSPPASQLRSFALSRFQGMSCRITLRVHRITVAVADGRCMVKAFLGISAAKLSEWRLPSHSTSCLHLFTLNNAEFP